MMDDISAAVEELSNGGVVALPTETVYGLAANALDIIAVKKIFEIKGRPLIDPLILHVQSAEFLQKYSNFNSASAVNRVKKLTDAFWPGPLTIVLPKKPIVPDLVTAGLDSVAIRCPSHEIFQNILSLIDFPLAAPSANPFGYISPTTAEQVRKSLGGKVKIIVDGGKCSVGLESTIIDLSKDFPRILRPGVIIADEISEVLKERVVDYDYQIFSDNPNSPGQMKQHYCTNTKLILFEHGIFPDRQKICQNSAIIFCKRQKEIGKIAVALDVNPENIFSLSEDGDLKTIARNLFRMLQTLDEAGVDGIFCERPKRKNIGIAIDDRLLRAEAKFRE